MKSLLPTGQWTGFYLEDHQPRRGWMHLYLQFDERTIQGEGTDYVGPWTLNGEVDSERQTCRWTKQYVGQHRVVYEGRITELGLLGQWRIRDSLTGNFHIWPAQRNDLNEKYLREDSDFDLRRHPPG